jgi:6-phosphofructokinase 1
VITFGFDSAVACATDALDRLRTTAESHERIMVLEVMGRYAGWIAAHAGIAGGGDVILIPEIPWTFESVCQAIINRENRGKKFTLIVVAEGAELPDKSLVTQDKHDCQQQVRLGGIGNFIGKEIERRLGKETRTVVLGHLQRGGAPTTFDRVVATQFGAHAVRLIVERKFGHMVTYQPPAMDDVPIIDAIKLSTVCPTCSAVQGARALGVSFGDDCTELPFKAAAPVASQQATQKRSSASASSA